MGLSRSAFYLLPANKKNIRTICLLLGALVLTYAAYRILGVPHFPLLAIALALTVLIALSALYLRSSNESEDLERLRVVAKVYYLGNTAALRPFQKRMMLNPMAWEEYDAADLLFQPKIVRENVFWPCVLCIAVVFTMATILFVAFDWNLYRWPSMILGGALAIGAEAAGCPSLEICNLEAQRRVSEFQLGSLQVMMYSFLAAYLWAIWQLFHRMVTRDVTVYAFHVITVRVVTTTILALILYQAISEPPIPRNYEASVEVKSIGDGTPAPAEEKTGSAPASAAAPVESQTDDAADTQDGLHDGAFQDIFTFNSMILLAFAIGFFPETALRWFSGIARRYVFRFGDRSTYFDLEMLEGVDSFTRARLAETGIIDATHLAASNPLTLSLRTPYTIQQIVDWMGQAQLMALVKTAEFNRLRNLGIRTSYQFYHETASGSAMAANSPLFINSAAALDRDPSFLRLKEVLDRMLIGPQL